MLHIAGGVVLGLLIFCALPDLIKGAGWLFLIIGMIVGPWLLIAALAGTGIIPSSAFAPPASSPSAAERAMPEFNALPITQRLPALAAMPASDRQRLAPYLAPCSTAVEAAGLAAFMTLPTTATNDRATAFAAKSPAERAALVAAYKTCKAVGIVG